MIDLAHKNTALKIAWIFRKDNYTLNQWDALIPKELGDKFWNCLLNKKDTEKYCARIANTFWAQIIKHWFKLTWEQHQKQLECDKCYLSMPLWYNSHIRIKGEVCYFKEMAEKGMLEVKDLIDDQGNVMSIGKIFENYGITVPWLDYYALIQAIPVDWLRTGKVAIEESLYNKILNTTKPVKYVCDLLNQSNKQALNYALEKINKKISVTQEEMRKAFQNIKKLTNITKYRDFQYRLLSNAIFTNDRLYYWKKVDTKKCEFCECEVQTIQHLMWECRVTQIIWKSLEKHATEHL